MRKGIERVPASGRCSEAISHARCRVVVAAARGAAASQAGAAGHGKGGQGTVQTAGIPHENTHFSHIILGPVRGINEASEEIIFDIIVCILQISSIQFHRSKF